MNEDEYGKVPLFLGATSVLPDVVKDALKDDDEKEAHILDFMNIVFKPNKPTEVFLMEVLADNLARMTISYKEENTPEVKTVCWHIFFLLIVINVCV